MDPGDRYLSLATSLGRHGHATMSTVWRRRVDVPLLRHRPGYVLLVGSAVAALMSACSSSSPPRPLTVVHLSGSAAAAAAFGDRDVFRLQGEGCPTSWQIWGQFEDKATGHPLGGSLRVDTQTPEGHWSGTLFVGSLPAGTYRLFAGCGKNLGEDTKGPASSFVTSIVTIGL